MIILSLITLLMTTSRLLCFQCSSNLAFFVFIHYKMITFSVITSIGILYIQFSIFCLLGNHLRSKPPKQFLITENQKKMEKTSKNVDHFIKVLIPKGFYNVKPRNVITDTYCYQSVNEIKWTHTFQPKITLIFNVSIQFISLQFSFGSSDQLWSGPKGSH